MAKDSQCTKMRTQRLRVRIETTLTFSPKTNKLDRTAFQKILK